jgi:hypothetical protein
LQHPRLQDAVPLGPPEPGTTKRNERTSEFGRVDYVLPGRGLRVHSAGVFRPITGDPQHRLIETPESSSDHYLVWVDVYVPQ